MLSFGFSLHPCEDDICCCTSLLSLVASLKNRYVKAYIGCNRCCGSLTGLTAVRSTLQLPSAQLCFNINVLYSLPAEYNCSRTHQHACSYSRSSTNWEAGRSVPGCSSPHANVSWAKYEPHVDASLQHQSMNVC